MRVPSANFPSIYNSQAETASQAAWLKKFPSFRLRLLDLFTRALGLGRLQRVSPTLDPFPGWSFQTVNYRYNPTPTHRS